MYKKGTKLRLKNIPFSKKPYLFKIKPNELGVMDEYAGKILTVFSCDWIEHKKCYSIRFKEDLIWSWSEDYIAETIGKKKENSI